MSESIDALIVGAGPVGLLMAHELRRHGVERVQIIDDREGPSIHSKALAVQPRTLELLDVSGLLDAALERGRRMHAIRARSGGRVLVHVDLSAVDSPTPWILVLPQYDTEGILIEALADRGVEVERRTRLVSLTQDVDGVDAVVVSPDGVQQTRRARWVIGCDGAHSTTRTQLGLPYMGEDIGTHIAFLDAESSWDAPDDELSLYLDEDGFCLCVALPRPGTWRFIASLPPGAEAVREKAWYQAIFAKRIPDPPVLGEATWMTDFVVRQRKVDRYRVGRVFLAGDAAHCHSPLGGRGMNTGLQDAWNLAWKLALVDAGRARTELLDSYTLEREPVASALLADVGRNTRAATLRHPVGRALRNTLMGVVSSFDFARAALAKNATQLDLHYRRSPMVAEVTTSLSVSLSRGSPSTEVASLADRREFAAGPQPGDRAPDVAFDASGDATLHGLLRGGRHVALLFDGVADTDPGYENLAAIADAIEARHGQVVTPYIIIPRREAPVMLGARRTIPDPLGAAHARYGAASECLYIIRPDGHVGFRSQPADAAALDAWLAKVFVS